MYLWGTVLNCICLWGTVHEYTPEWTNRTHWLCSPLILYALWCQLVYTTTSCPEKPCLKKKYLFHVCGYTVTVFRHTRRGHWIPITHGCEPTCGCWELNSRPLEKQSVLLTYKLSLQPPSEGFCLFGFGLAFWVFLLFYFILFFIFSFLFFSFFFKRFIYLLYVSTL